MSDEWLVSSRMGGVAVEFPSGGFLPRFAF